ncbi:MAG: hypothetical protein HRT64_00670, partial [Erythrobacter sp.]|nr:hypothetical protein [Erythrobacter sp.]
MATLAPNPEVNALGHDKVKRYNWAKPTDKGEFRYIHKRLLRVNDAYQREAFKSKQIELASNWSWIACGVIIVAERDGHFWTIDGQHRKLAADRRSDITELPCMVFKVDGVREEAKAFLATNTNRKPVTALGKFKALLTAEDPAALLVDAVVRDCGLRFATASKEVGDFKAVGWALNAAQQDENAFVEVMQLAAQLALEAKAPVHHHIVKGLQYINANVEGGLANDRLRKRLLQVGMGG